MLLGVVDHGALELLREHVAQHADREIRLLEDEGGRLDLAGAALHDLGELVEVIEVALEVVLGRALRGGAHDDAAVALVELLQELSLPVALGVGQPAAGADARALRHVDEVPPGDRELHRKAGALRLQGVLDHLDEDLLLGLDQLGDRAALAVAAPRHLLPARQDDLVHVQEAVSLEADVDERGLHAGQDVVDDPLVDVADDRPRSAALDVELANPWLGVALPFEHRDAGLAGVD